MELISALGLRVVPAVVTNFVSLRNKHASSPDLGREPEKSSPDVLARSDAKYSAMPRCYSRTYSSTPTRLYPSSPCQNKSKEVNPINAHGSPYRHAQCNRLDSCRWLLSLRCSRRTCSSIRRNDTRKLALTAPPDKGALSSLPILPF